MGQMSRYRCVHSLALSFRKAVLSFRHWDPRMQAFWLNNMLPVLAGNLVGAVFCCGTHPHLAACSLVPFHKARYSLGLTAHTSVSCACFFVKLCAPLHSRWTQS